LFFRVNFNSQTKENVVADRSVCQSGWDAAEGKCYLFQPQEAIKPDAKRFCYDLNASLLIVETAQQNAFLASKLSPGESFWLRINDGKQENNWVIDRWGYTKPTAVTPVSYFNWNANEINDDIKNSAKMDADGTWSLVDRYALSRFACQTDQGTTD